MPSPPPRTQRGAHHEKRNDLLCSILTEVQSRFAIPPIGPFQALFLLAVLNLGPAHAYGRQIATWFEDKLGRRVNIAQVYSTADTLLEQALVSSLDLPNPHGTGRFVVVYTLTPAGHAILAAVEEYFVGMSRMRRRRR